MDHAADAHRTDLMTITRHVLNEQSRYPESRGDFTILLSHIVLGCKFVASAVNKAGLAKLIGLAGETNVQASYLDQSRPVTIFLPREIELTMPRRVRVTGRGAEEAGRAVERGVRQGPRQQRPHRRNPSSLSHLRLSVPVRSD
jgi:fructose-1,6-bisphosphatase I